jgi:hypothetical protein
MGGDGVLSTGAVSAVLVPLGDPTFAVASGGVLSTGAVSTVFFPFSDVKFPIGGGAVSTGAVSCVSFPSAGLGRSSAGVGILPSAPGVPGGTPRLPANSMVFADTSRMFSSRPDAMRWEIRIGRTSPNQVSVFLGLLLIPSQSR